MIEANEFLYLLPHWIEIDAYRRLHGQKYPRLPIADLYFNSGAPNYSSPRRSYMPPSYADMIVLRAQNMGYEVFPFQENPSWPAVISLSLNETQTELLFYSGMRLVNPSWPTASGMSLFGEECEITTMMIPRGGFRKVFFFPRLRFQNHHNPSMVIYEGEGLE